MLNDHDPGPHSAVQTRQCRFATYIDGRLAHLVLAAGNIADARLGHRAVETTPPVAIVSLQIPPPPLAAPEGAPLARFPDPSGAARAAARSRRGRAVPPRSVWNNDHG